MAAFILLLAIVILALAWLSSHHGSSPPKGTREPPGPPGLPFLGNLRQVPSGFRWYTYTRWSNKYGPLVKFNVAGQPHIIVGTEKIANDLMRERGSLYSSREQTPMAAKLLSHNMRPVLLPYGEVWRNGRKLMHHLTMPAAARRYEPTQEEESIRVLYDLMLDTSKYEQWFERYAAGVIMRLAFGQTIITGQEEYIRRIYQILRNLSRVSDPRAYLVNVFPILLHLPTWLAPFKREAAQLHAEEIGLFSSLVHDVEQRLADGDATAENTFTTRWLKNKPVYGLTDHEAYYVLGTLFEAGAGTTSATMMSLVLAMTLYPDKFEKLKAEVDKAVGPTRFPTFSDFQNLPYMRACVKETLRWRPVTPAGIPHQLVRDDVYEGYFFKKGTIFQLNQWGIHRQPDLYPDPETFLPERWIEEAYPTYQEPLSTCPNLSNFSAFGFGRRICPGLHIAENSLYLLTSRIAWAFDIKAKPNIMYKDDDYLPRGVTQPQWFDFALLPRNGRGEMVDAAYSAWADKQQ